MQMIAMVQEGVVVVEGEEEVGDGQRRRRNCHDG